MPLRTFTEKSRRLSRLDKLRNKQKSAARVFREQPVILEGTVQPL